LIVALLLANTQAVRHTTHNKKKSVVEIDLKKTAYELPKEFTESVQVSEDIQMAFSSLVQKSGDQNNISLLQKNIETIDMKNLMNMGYEGKFWFGNPSQEMDVIFDTGSAWAWVFSEKCNDKNCPKENQKYF